MLCIFLTLYLHLLCACMTYMYLSAIVAAKKISFIRMMVSPAASIIQFYLKRARVMRMEVVGKSPNDDTPSDDQYMQWWYPTVWRVQMAPIKLYRGAKWGRDADYRGAAVKLQLKQGLALQRWQGFDKSICSRIRGQPPFFLRGFISCYLYWLHLDWEQCIVEEEGKWTAIINIILAVCQLQLAWW